MKNIFSHLKINRRYRGAIYTVQVFEDRAEVLNFMMIDCPVDASKSKFLFKNVFRTNSYLNPWFYCILPDGDWNIIGRFSDVHQIIDFKLLKQASEFVKREDPGKNWFLLTAKM